MATHVYNDKVKFVLPPGFIFSRKKDDEGDEIVRILAGEYGDDGATSYNFVSVKTSFLVNVSLP